MIGSIAAAVAARLAAGVLLAGGAIALRHRVPDAFLRFLIAGAAAGFGLAAVLARDAPELPVRAGLAVAALALWWFHRRGGIPSRRAAALGLAAGILGVCLPALVGPGASAWRSLAAGIPASLLLGSVAATMILGHWYLVDTRLSIAPLASGASFYVGAASLRVAVSAAALAVGGMAALGISAPGDVIYSTNALFFSFRTITGLAAPLVLAFLVRSTVRIRSTQSATGLLYVALILVLFGELTAAFLERVSAGALL